MGVTAKTIDSSAQLKAELTEVVKGISVVVVNVPNREANAELLKRIYSGIASM
jgi:2-succinyl-5-enolpyruvyl-6-hydroxy-3-cyclohexene-1-carboxylate synthase